ncbi:MAG: hypothetical protein M1536_06250 [Firmicutes bacterium]|nr:hypothetical protein [Bacillota bacterium]
MVMVEKCAACQHSEERDPWQGISFFAKLSMFLRGKKKWTRHNVVWCKLQRKEKDKDGRCWDFMFKK